LLRIDSKLRMKNMPKSGHDFGTSFETFVLWKTGPRFAKIGPQFYAEGEK